MGATLFRFDLRGGKTMGERRKKQEKNTKRKVVRLSSARLRACVRTRRTRFVWILAAVLLVSPAPVAGAAEATPKLDKDAARWLREVHLLILPEEELAFRGLTSPEDRTEFQRIFW